MSEQQLRIYGIAPGHLDDFVAAWAAGVLPLRRRFGFRVDAWTVPGEHTFVWLLTWDGPGSLADADAAYYASPERGSLRPDPAQWIRRQDVYGLAAVTAVTGRLPPFSGGGSAP